MEEVGVCVGDVSRRKQNRSWLSLLGGRMGPGE